MHIFTFLVKVHLTFSSNSCISLLWKAALALSSRMMDHLAALDKNHITAYFLRLLYFFSLPINRTARSCHMWVNSPLSPPPTCFTLVSTLPNSHLLSIPRCSMWTGVHRVGSPSLCVRGRGDMNQPIGSRDLKFVGRSVASVCVSVTNSARQ